MSTLLWTFCPCARHAGNSSRRAADRPGKQMPPGSPAAPESQSRSAASEELDLPGLLSAALAVVLEHEGDLVAFVEGVDAGALEGGGVNEHVLAAVLGRDEAVAFGAVVEFHGSRDAVHVGPSQMGVVGSQSADGTPPPGDLRYGKGQTAGGALVNPINRDGAVHRGSHRRGVYGPLRRQKQGRRGKYGCKSITPRRPCGRGAAGATGLSAPRTRPAERRLRIATESTRQLISRSARWRPPCRGRGACGRSRPRTLRSTPPHRASSARGRAARSAGSRTRSPACGPARRGSPLASPLAPA